MPKTLDDLLAEAAIKDVHIRYCRANDRRDEELMRSCFHPDARVELHESLDVEAFIAMGCEMLGQFSATWHNTGNQLVEVDGEVAWAEHYTTSTHRMPADQQQPERDLVVYGRYVDRMERRGGEWRIGKRVMLIDFSRMEEIRPAALPLGANVSARDRSDPSYALRVRSDRSI